jgi:hypothetical protein
MVTPPASVNAQAPRITSQPGDATVILNDSVTLSVAADVTDGGTLSYQWYSSTTDRNTGGTLIRGATSRTFTPPTTREGVIFYYVVVTNTNNNATGTTTAATTSGTAKVTVNALVNAQTPNITGQPAGGIVIVDDSFSLSVTASVRDKGTLSYQWFWNDTNSNTGGTLINGATRATFSPETDTLGVTYYYVEVTNTNNDVTGAKIVMTVSTAVPVIVCTTPGAPQHLTAIPEENQVTLSWTPPEDDGGSEIIGYQVSDNIVTLWMDANGEYEHTVTGLNSETEYTFKVRAVNAAGYGKETTLTVMTTGKEVVSATGVSLSEEVLNLLEGESATLAVTVSPRDADDKSVTWESSNTDVATVDEHGVVTALAEGTAIITVTTNDGGHTASCSVTVEHTGMHFDHLLLWIGLGTLAPLGTGTGVYLWRRNKK